MSKKEAIIVDIDGTLANCEHRRHFVDGTDDKKDWVSFYESMRTDTVNEWCRFILDACYDEFGWARMSILLVSGRPEEYKELTLNWLTENNLCSGQTEKIFMRKTGDYRDDSIVKEEIYREHIEPHYNILFVIDDRKKVVDMWRKLGLVCLHCADGDF